MTRRSNIISEQNFLHMILLNQILKIISTLHNSPSPSLHKLFLDLSFLLPFWCFIQNGVYKLCWYSVDIIIIKSWLNCWKSWLIVSEMLIIKWVLLLKIHCIHDIFSSTNFKNLCHLWREPWLCAVAARLEV